MEELEGMSARIWASTDELHIVLAVNAATPLPLEVIDATGRSVMSVRVSGANITVPFTAPSGVYVALLGNGAQRVAVRFVN